MTEQLISFSELCRRSHRSPSTLRAMIRRGELVPAMREESGRKRVLFDRRAVELAGLQWADPGDDPRVSDGTIDEAIRAVIQEELAPLIAQVGDLAEVIHSRLHVVDEIPGTSRPTESMLRRMWAALLRALRRVVRT